MTIDALVKLIGAILTFLGLVVTPCAYLFRKFVEYLIARIGVLEERETTLLTGMVEAIKEIGHELDAQGDLVRAISKQEERRQWDRDREREARP